MITTARIAEIYATLEKLVVQLHPDPRSLGPVYLQNLIATCRNYLNDLDRILRELHRINHSLSSALRVAEVDYQVESDVLLANDERVRRLPSIEDRRAFISVILRERRAAIETIKTQQQDVQMVDKIVRHQHKQLTATMGEIKLQRSLIDAEIRTGAMYGDERETAVVGSGSDLDDKELQAIFNEEREKQEASLSKPPASSGPSATQTAMDNFVATDEDLTGIFDSE